MGGGTDGAAAGAPRVSIIVPAHDCVELTEECLASIARHTPEPHEVLLVDDASGPAAAAAFRRLAAGPVRLLRNGERSSFSASNNRAAAAARGAYLCLLNNDTRVTPGWLEALLAVAAREPGLGVLGNKHLFPDRPGLHHAGMAFDAAGAPVHLHPHTDPAAPAVNYERDVPCVTFACALIPAAVYRRLGGLDEDYRNGYEDCDFCLRARGAGLRVLYTPASVILHHGQGTPGRTAHDDANWRTFRAKWPGRERGSLERLTREDRDHNRRVARRPRLRPAPPAGLHLAVDFSAGNAFTWAAASLVEALLAAPDPVPVSVPRCRRIARTVPPGQRRMLRALMRPRACGTWHVKWSHYWPAHLGRPLSGEVNAELFCTNYRGGAGVRASDRWLRNVQLNGHFKLPVARFNLEALGDLGVPERDCAVVPLGYSPEVERLFPRPPARPQARERHLLHVTNSHDPLRYGTDLALAALGRAFGPADPVVVHLKDYGGAGGDRLRRWVAEQPRFPRVVWHERFLPKEELVRLYAGMDLVLAPFRGEGFAMKILDAMALGVPVLMPAFGGPTEFAPAGTFLEVPWTRAPVGACLDRESWHLSDEAWWCEPDPAALAEALRDWAGDDGPARRAGAAAATHVRGRFTWANAADRLLDALRGWRSRRLVAASVLARPDRLPLSVVVLAPDRAGTLAPALEAYASQTPPAGGWELLLAGSGGSRPALEEEAAPFRERLPLAFVGHEGAAGVGPAANAGIARASGEVVLLAPGDVVPSAGLLAEHVAGHRRFPEVEVGIVGPVRSEGDPLGTPSFKRAFLAAEPGPFRTDLPPGLEVADLALRLRVRGLELRPLPGLTPLQHAETTEYFLRRRVPGEGMLSLLALVHPGLLSSGGEILDGPDSALAGRALGPVLAAARAAIRRLFERHLV